MAPKIDMPVIMAAFAAMIDGVLEMLGKTAEFELIDAVIEGTGDPLQPVVYPLCLRQRREPGGIVPLLNDLSGNPVPAPECLRLEADDFIPPSGTYTDTVETPGTELYQCCIHPWMRATVHVRG